MAGLYVYLGRKGGWWLEEVRGGRDANKAGKRCVKRSNTSRVKKGNRRNIMKAKRRNAEREN